MMVSVRLILFLFNGKRVMDKRTHWSCLVDTQAVVLEWKDTSGGLKELQKIPNWDKV